MKGLKIKGELLMGESLSNHTFLRLGGKAKYFLFANNAEDIIKAITFSYREGIPNYIIGKGSNVLFLDEGFSGLIITTERMDEIVLEEDKIRAQAGATLNHLINCAKEASLSGIESLVDIPGSIGGASVMNAGAFECEIGDWIIAASVLRDGKVQRLTNINFGYRESSLTNEIVLEVELLLKEEEREKIEKKIQKAKELRKISQPELSVRMGTCGSVFKNPEGFSAGKLIEKAGLKGKRIGGAEISRKHGNFILTSPSSSSNDVVNLIRLVKDEVRKILGINFETEVVIVGKEKEIQI